MWFLFKKIIENIFLYSANQFDSKFNKKYIIYLYGPTYHFKDCKNHLWYIATKTFCNGLELIHRRYSYRSWKYWKNVCIKDKERRRWQIMMRLVHSSNETKWTNHRAALKRKKTLNFFIIFNLIIESLHNNNFLLYTIQVYSRSNRLAFLKNEVFL